MLIRCLHRLGNPITLISRVSREVCLNFNAISSGGRGTGKKLKGMLHFSIKSIVPLARFASANGGNFRIKIAIPNDDGGRGFEGESIN